MLTRLIVALYAKLVEGALWLTLAFAMGAGYHLTVPVMNAAGASPSPELVWRILGAAALTVVVFFFLAVLVGPVLLLLDVRTSVRLIEAKMDREEQQGAVPQANRAEPTI